MADPMIHVEWAETIEVDDPTLAVYVGRVPRIGEKMSITKRSDDPTFSTKKTNTVVVVDVEYHINRSSNELNQYNGTVYVLVEPHND